MNNKKISHRREDIVKIRVSRNFADFTDKWPGPAHKVEPGNVQRNEHKHVTPPIESACGKEQQSPHDTKTDYGVDNQSKCKPTGIHFAHIVTSIRQQLRDGRQVLRGLLSLEV
jgi:hypothetical protein